MPNNRPAMSNKGRRPDIQSENVNQKLQGRIERDLMQMSRHHVVDIQGMGEFFDVGRAIIKRAPVDASKVDALQRKVAQGGPRSNRDRTGPIGLSLQQSLRDNFMWSPINLFVGPSAQYRSDDPGNRTECNKPISMSDIRWRTLKSVETFLVRLVRTSEGRFSENAITKQIATEYIDILKALVSLTVSGEGRVHLFEYNDWKLTGTRHQGNFAYRLKKLQR